MTATPRSYFEDMYAKSADPWKFESRAYEQRKYAFTTESIPRARYRRAFEPGCSVGVLTKLLAARCDELIAYEIIPRAAEAARERVAHLGHVHIEQRAIPNQWPNRMLDLIVLSEVVYYFDEIGVRSLLDKVNASLSRDGHVVAVHYRGKTNYPISGDRAHELLRAAPFLRLRRSYEEAQFRIDVFERTTS